MVRSLFLTGGMSWIVEPGGFDQYFSCPCTDTTQCPGVPDPTGWDLIVTVGWRHIISEAVLETTPLGVVGFHSARLPEYPGRAPVPWAILRGDTVTHNTMLFLTDEPDAGDIIDFREVPVTTASEMNRRMGSTAAEMIEEWMPFLGLGTAPRTPQDRSRRGPLTTANGWQLLPEDRR